MLTPQRSPEDNTAAAGYEGQIRPPIISLPKGGGAIRGIGEKFAANPVTGTGSMTVPIATSPSRSGFGPQLALSYDSGAGNGPFGFGWSLSLPSITRKTDKGLPQYRDAEESDVFVLSSAEDLVPELVEVGGQWQPEPLPPRTVGGVEYRIQRYRPRIEGLFARIERWTSLQTGETHWRSIARDNITTLYGKDNNSRIFDPNDPDSEHPTRIFSWLICASYDDKGNVTVYEYKEENSQGVEGSFAHERNRTDLIRSANRYLKSIKYGNRRPNRDGAWQPTDPTLLDDRDWMFEVIFDYGEAHSSDLPRDPTRSEAAQHRFVTAQVHEASPWLVRKDPISSYRAGFELRTYRLCRRVLMFHHFPEELGTADYLVRSTDFSYAESPIASFITSVTQSGYVHQPTLTQPNRYLQKSLPPLEFEYSEADIDETVQEIDSESLENLPYGLDGANYQWVDLDGEGISGILTEQADGWFYKRNLSPAHRVRDNGSERMPAWFAPVELVIAKPNTSLASGQAQFMDLAGDGQVDLVQLDAPMRGFYERTDDADWVTFRPFTACPNLDMRDPNLRFIDLDGDGHTDILVSEDDVFSWHASLAEQGFGPAARVPKSDDEEKGPRLVFANGTQSIYLADLSGDGLTDLVRIRNGEVCYWPNLGYGRFGAKVTMDTAPWFESPDLFDQSRVRLGDIDGSGTTDVFYLSRDGITIWRNQSGNSWSAPKRLSILPPTDSLSSVTVVDLLGNGTACLLWSSPLPGYAGRHMRYVDLIGGQKPHLLIKVVNNLGAETRVHYSPSTKFYVEDKLSGEPWITRLPFPVHVVEWVETYDYVSRNRFVTRYAYHHGYFDGEEREFRGFGMVEQFDTEEFAALSASGDLPIGDNIDAASHVPPVHTKTWFHTGVYFDREHISHQFEGEYYREPGLNDQEFRALLLLDTTLPANLTLEEERESCRALKGMMLRQEVYADDAPPGSSEAIIQRARIPYTVVEQNFTIHPLQPRAGNRHAVFFTHPREALTFHYERNSVNPRIQHALMLEVDNFGNALREAIIGYGRCQPDATLPLQADQDKQAQTIITYTENRFTNAIDDAAPHPDDYRTPLPCETRTYELTGFKPENNAARFSFDEWTRNGFALPGPATEISYEKTVDNASKQKRLIEHVRTLYRKDNLTALLPLREVEPLALSGESYKLAFTPGLLAQVYQRPRNGQSPVNLLPNPASVLGGQAGDQGGYLASQGLKAVGTFPNTDPDDHWWIPAGRVFHSPNTSDNAALELTHARQHFFLPRRYRDPFGHTTAVVYDAYDLLMTETRDPLGNRVTVGERDAAGNVTRAGNDYRVLQPRLVTDPNRNRTEVAFDTIGMVVGTAVQGKDNTVGDTLSGFEPDLTQAQVDGFYDVADPHGPAPSLLKSATTRIIYDLDRFRRAQQAYPEDPAQWRPVYAATLVRETHVSEPLPPQGLKIQISFSYSDGFRREIQKKIQAESGPLVEDGPVVSPRWVSSGWIIFNNKGKPVRQYEPFFSQLPEKRHQFEFGVQVGVSPILFYDPVERVVATLHPNHTYEKVVFDPWLQTTYDVNDTVATNGTETGDPRTDADIQGYVAEYFKTQPNTWQTWYEQRIMGAKGAQEKGAAEKAAQHANTPTTAHFDTLGRPFLTVAHNRFDRNNIVVDEKYPTRVLLDIEGNQREVRDAIEQNSDAQGRVVMRYDYDLLGNRIHQASMEAGERWMLHDITGKPIRSWDSRGQVFRFEYDSLRRPLRSFVTGADPTNPNQELLTERLVYGEQHPEDELRNLRGKLSLHLDQAGVVTNEAHDFKGNLLHASRRLAREYKQVIDWNAVNVVLPANSAIKLNPTALEVALAPRLAADTFTRHTAYDALNRPVQLIAPHSDQPGAKRNVIQPVYNEANLLERVHVWLDHPTEPIGLLNPATVPFTPVGVNNIDYDAKGQRLCIEYKNGATTRYAYDPQTFRLTHLYTRRGVTFTEDCGGDPPSRFAAPDAPPPNTPCGLQNLHYTYDPAGNITHLRDDAQQIIYFGGQVVPPHCDYTYDAIYRLIVATGREHIGQVGQPETTWNDEVRVRLPHPGDGQAMRNYAEYYEYDAVGNFEKLIHQAANGSWTRSYAYNEASLIESAKQSNRLSSTTVGSGPPETYPYDAHGNMTRMNHLPLMQWDYRDQLQATAQQMVNHGTPETTWYAYDASGQRVRKVTELATGQVKDECIYLGGFEVYRKQGVNAVVRETLHIMDDKQRIASVETRVHGNEPGVPPQCIRYQFGNHLGSASLELDHQADIISYEEYYPYGSTSYQAVRSRTETPKCYRYTGKERDDETGLYYHGARYYACWLARWTAPDTIGLADGINVFRYVHANPVRLTDQTGLAGGEDDWSEVDKVRKELHKEGTKLDLKDKRTHAEPLKKPLTKKEAREYANKQAARERIAAGMTDPEVQAGHTAAARDAPRSGIKPADWDKQPFQQLPSRKGKGLDVAVTDQAGVTKTNTRHRAQEKLIDQETARVVEKSGKKLTPQGQLDAAEQVARVTENVPLDQRNIDLLRKGGYAKPEPGPQVNPETGIVERSAAASAARGGKFGGRIKGGAKAVAPIILTYFWDLAREENAETMRGILANTNPTQEELEFAEIQGFQLKSNPDTGKREWYWAPSWDRRIVEIFHFLLTFEDPWERFAPTTSQLYGPDMYGPGA